MALGMPGAAKYPKTGLKKTIAQALKSLEPEAILGSLLPLVDPTH
jgi:hypothetical protein